MIRFPWRIVAFLVALQGGGAVAQNLPHVGYIYPAGARLGDEIEVTIGGQYLDEANQIIISGRGVQATVVEHIKPMPQKRINELRQKIQQARTELQQAQREQAQRELARRQQAQRSRGQRAQPKRPVPAPAITLKMIADKAELDIEEVQKYEETRKKAADPKRQLNPQLSETVKVRMKVSPDTAPGDCELRLLAKNGLSNPLTFQIGQLPEHREVEPNDKTPDASPREPLPITLNGQVMPGDVDRFRIQARKGEKLVVVASARQLMPYLADAVPGWFQATLALYDATGNELAFADDYQFHPDPVLYYEIPKNGDYVLEIRDAIYRGREDFVYRITVGELPFVTSIFPLGGRYGEQAAVELQGWNLRTRKVMLDAQNLGLGVHPVSVTTDKQTSNFALFAVDMLTEAREQEPNNEAGNAQLLRPPIIVNGRIDHPGDWDVFYFPCRAGGQIAVEVKARRLSSPVDSVIRFTDSSGRILAVNDDHEDRGAGLETHHADSLMIVTAPSDGFHYLYLGDTQHKGGPAYSYRLHIDAQRPDFKLRVAPSSINATAGATVPITVHALREDGFDGDIQLHLKNAPEGFLLAGGWVPGNESQTTLTLTVPPAPPKTPVSLQIEGRARINGHDIRRPAVPADDMMQAFIYRHLVSAKNLIVSVSDSKRYQALTQRRAKGRAVGPLNPFGDEVVALPLGGTARIPLLVPRSKAVDQIELGLTDAPEGISIRKATSDRGPVAVVLSADAAKVEPGLKGNLIAEAFVVRPDPSKPGQTRRTSQGILPAIRFEVVGR